MLSALAWKIKVSSVIAHVSHSVRLKVNGWMTNAIFFLAANTFPVCSPDVGWKSQYATSEVREITAVPAVKSCNDC
jgi:hypothetical protein